jgi:hypothetical protein
LWLVGVENRRSTSTTQNKKLLVIFALCFVSRSCRL